MAADSTAVSNEIAAKRVPKGVVVLLGRLLFALIFSTSGVGHFSSATIAYAESQGVPLASLVVPFSGIIALLGGLSILVGYRAKLGAWLIVLFLVPVTLMMHKFWGVPNPMMALINTVVFVKNLSMLAGALLITQFGAGPFSVDAQQGR